MIRFHSRSICATPVPALARPSTSSLFSSAAPDVGSVQEHRIVARKSRYASRDPYLMCHTELNSGVIKGAA
jgi:hypothetical protein